MKKLSISVFALLAIVFAVSSAFTSFESTTYKVFANTSQSAWQSAPSGPQAVSEGLEIQDYGISQPDALMLNTLQEQRCEEAEKICFVVVKFEDGTAQSTLEAVRDGEFIEN